MEHRHGPGRPRAFDPDAALAAALDLFWARGFEATGIEALTQAMGLSRSSLYAAYGSKQGVLRAALAWYSDTACAALADRMAAAPDAQSAVRAAVAAIADPHGDRRGCFHLNCVTELAPHDRAIEALGLAHHARLESLLAAQPGCDPARARALLALAHGLTLMRKAGLPAPDLVAAMDQIGPLLPPPGLSSQLQ